jgi:predicted secreted protein
MLLALASAGCGGDGDDDSGIVFQDPRRPVAVEKGMTFSIEYSVNAGVGTDWEVVEPRASGPVELERTDVDYPDEEREGDSGRKRFVFEAKRTGSEAVVFRKLYRGDQQEVRTVTMQVRE